MSRRLSFSSRRLILTSGRMGRRLSLSSRWLIAVFRWRSPVCRSRLVSARWWLITVFRWFLRWCCVRPIRLPCRRLFCRGLRWPIGGRCSGLVCRLRWSRLRIRHSMKRARCGFRLAHGNCSSRRSHLRYNGSARKLFRGTRRWFRRSIRSCDSARRGSNCGGLHYPCVLNLLRVHLNVSLGYRLTILERVPRNSGDRMWRILVHISAVYHSRPIHDCGVVDIHDFRSIDHSRIRYVDP